MIMKKIILIILSMFLFCCFVSCDKDIDINTAFPFSIEEYPVKTELMKGEFAELRFNLIVSKKYDDAVYSIKYFQVKGSGRLMLGNKRSKAMKVGNSYPITAGEFILYYEPLSKASTRIQIIVEDSNQQKQVLEYDIKREEHSYN